MLQIPEQASPGLMDGLEGTHVDFTLPYLNKAKSIDHQGALLAFDRFLLKGTLKN